MQVAIQSGTGSPAQLIDDGIIFPLDDQHLRCGGNVQDLKNLRAPSAKTVDRLNEMTFYQVSGIRKFNSPGDCEDFFLTHRGNIPRSGTLILTSSGSTGVHSIPDATIISVDFQQTGAAVQITYVFRGGAIVKGIPRAPVPS